MKDLDGFEGGWYIYTKEHQEFKPNYIFSFLFVKTSLRVRAFSLCVSVSIPNFQFRRRSLLRPRPVAVLFGLLFLFFPLCLSTLVRQICLFLAPIGKFGFPISIFFSPLYFPTMHPLFSSSFSPIWVRSLLTSPWTRSAPNLFCLFLWLYRKVHRALARVFAPPPSTCVSFLALLSVVPLASSLVFYHWWRHIGFLWSSIEDDDVCFSFCC